MNKEELNQEIGKLKASLEAHESQVKDLQQDLKNAEKKLQMIQGLIDANASDIKKLLLLQNEK